MSARKKPGPERFAPGYYKHYKGKLCYAISIGRDNSHDPAINCVVYFCLDDSSYNSRPLADPRFDSWCDLVEVDGIWIPRFTRVEHDAHLSGFNDVDLKELPEGRLPSDPVHAYCNYDACITDLDIKLNMSRFVIDGSNDELLCGRPAVRFFKKQINQSVLLFARCPFHKPYKELSHLQSITQDEYVVRLVMGL